MKKKEISIQRSDFPVELQPFLSGEQFWETTSNPETPVIFCEPDFYIKQAPKGKLAQEAAMATLFARRGLGPAVELYFSGSKDYLVTHAVQGESLLHYQNDPVRLCEALAHALHILHDQPAMDVPLSSAQQFYMHSPKLPPSQLNTRMRLERFPVTTPGEAFALAAILEQHLYADTLIHGDACLPNIFLKDWKFSSFIDCAQSGLGNRHIDLYWALWSLQFNLKTPQYSDTLLDAYGRKGIDTELLRAISAMEMSQP